ncbi:trypsin-like peptidase domain-containing protein, partial [Streptomyces beihaiensis]
MVDPPLVRISDLAGRPRGAGFVADDRGTVVTSHEAVDGLGHVVVHAPDGGTCLVSADGVVPLPGADLALVRTDGLDVAPLAVAALPPPEQGAYVRIPAGGWREARVLGQTSVTYTATDGLHLLDHAVELAVGTAGADALRVGGGAAGGPVVDAAT